MANGHIDTDSDSGKQDILARVARHTLLLLCDFADRAAGEGICFRGDDPIDPADLLFDWWNVLGRTNEYDPREVSASLLAALTPQWQPIETAPRDGTQVLFADGAGSFPFVAFWGCVGRYTSSPKMWVGHEFGAMEDNSAYRWMPLPQAPKP